MKITVNPELPGILALFDFSPKTAEPLCLLAERLLVEENSLSKADRELVATYTSYLNNCEFCMKSHAGVTECHRADNVDVIETFKKNFAELNLTPKMNMLLKVAHAVQQDGKKMSQDLANECKSVGCSEKEIHDTVLITSAFCMYNRYVDALSVFVPIEKAIYKDIGSLYGFDGFGIFNAVDGVSAKKVAKVINKKAYRNTATLMSDGNFWMTQAYNASQKSIGRLKKAWNGSGNPRADEAFFVFNTGFLNVNRDEIEQNLVIMDRVVTSQGTESLRSAVTGEVVQVNYKNLFTNPPKDLKAFLPTGFDSKSTITREIANLGKKQIISYRNYAEGTPTEWNTAAFEPYFPGIKKSSDVYKTVRVLSHAGGNWLQLQ